MTHSLEQRARRIRSRAVIRAMEYRQRKHARGVWFRLRRVLADAERAFVIPDEALDRLVAEGWKLEQPGLELEPKKRLVFLSDARIRQIEGARSIPVSLGADFLQATSIALIRFEST
jgi:hypothetical protein